VSNWLIVGLGNPGPEYEKTRHNLGFMLVDLLARRLGATVRRKECRSLMGRAVFENLVFELAKPQTYMNLSGEAVGCLLGNEERSIERLVVVSDDLALPLGTIRIRPKGTHGGHNGLRSIIDRLGTQEFTRLRIGILPGHPIADPRRFVLDEFAGGDADLVRNVLETAADAAETIVRDGIATAMAKFNGVVEDGK
jgi:peptidyl-tRNA hydrolase, PTH1 family